MRPINELILSRENSFKFLIGRSRFLPEPSLKMLMQYISDNEIELSSRAVDISTLSNAIDPAKAALSSFIGLFWFTPDYKQVTDIIGVKEFTSGDVSAKLDVFPEGFHNDFADNPSKIPRGRVSLSRGTVIINVGLQCPDSAILLVVEAFGLKPYEDVLHVGKGYHWDYK